MGNYFKEWGYDWVLNQNILLDVLGLEETHV